MPIRVVIADDYLPFRVMLRYVLGDEPDVEIVGEAEDGQAAVELVAKLAPDVILLDLAMPRLDGWEAIPLIRDCSPTTQIIVLSGFPEVRMRDPSLREAISRYVEKGEPEETIRAAVREVASARPAASG